MDILKLLNLEDRIRHYEVRDFRQWPGGLYYKLKIVFSDQSILFVREYVDESDRNYSFHWQDKDGHLITRWDNAPHHHNIATFPHHKHDKEDNVSGSTELILKEVIEIIKINMVSS